MESDTEDKIHAAISRVMDDCSTTAPPRVEYLGGVVTCTTQPRLWHVSRAELKRRIEVAVFTAMLPPN